MPPPRIETTVKGLAFDADGRVLLLRERSGRWDLPGGRLEHGETFAECLRRECREEMGVACRVLDSLPRLAWTALDKDGNWRAMLCFRIELDDLGITPSEECESHGFFELAELDGIDLYPQTRPLAGELRRSRRPM